MFQQKLEAPNYQSVQDQISNAGKVLKKLQDELWED
jgi:hypothetical protein